MKTKERIYLETEHLTKKGFLDLSEREEKIVETLKDYYWKQIVVTIITTILLTLFLCFVVKKSHAQNEAGVKYLNDSIIPFMGDTLHYNHTLLPYDSTGWYIVERPNDTVSVYIMYIDTKSSNVYSPPTFTNAQFENESTRKTYDNNVYWTHGYLVTPQWNDRYLLNDKKKRFSENIIIWDWRQINN